MECIDDIFLDTGLDGFVGLVGVEFSTRAGNLVKTLRKNRFQFIFDAPE
jgi:hypothetical protein